MVRTRMVTVIILIRMGKIHICVLESQINKHFAQDGNAVNNTAKKGRFQLTKMTYKNGEHSASELLSGAKYKIEKYNDANGKWEAYNVGTSDGKITVNSVYTSGLMEPGQYRVIETDPPTSIQNSNGVKVNFDVNPTPIPFTIAAGATVKIEQYDGILRTLKVTKTADDKNDDKLLADVTFELWTYKDASEEGLTSEYDKVCAHKDTPVGNAQTTGADVWSAGQIFSPGSMSLWRRRLRTDMCLPHRL